ncbi:chromosomal replication initiator protein DnaA [bacterium]|jgi:chromosomal replication initiator protein|nr:chromosomal replication initiator protein DnaA [bacterium]MDP6571552.1 chromosomal replication initiator protein DnaA [Patescibacteria group bacterium]MDP6756466.1 chromosomal replication initiator protein DnaA [Patescibacteria group bacterium]|tara:strand:+ start:4245 stop:5630 length:1386 start_codon:yes stop_codon:yes gene_type:complete
MNSEQLWQATLGELELSVSKVHFTTWFRNTFIIDWQDNKVVVAVPNNFTKAWLENKYHKSILEVLQNISENKISYIEYRVETAKHVDSGSVSVGDVTAAEAGSESSEAVQDVQPQASGAKDSGLNVRYIFANYIVGKGNELAYAASVRVAKEPGTKYNPLFLYGGVGLGKTHLMLAVGNELLLNNQSLKILYITGEQFTNDYVSSLQSGNVDKFKHKYRTPDLLLVDDIQFIGGKEQTQEQFFHVFNALRDSHKQIVLTSDRPPKAIPALEERLISRFEWGMIADISSPDLETRMAILQSKSKERGIELDEEVQRFLATNVQSNVRELEGALNRLLAYAELHNASPDLDVAREVVSSITVSQRRGGVTIRELVKIVAEYFDISLEDLSGQSRRKELVVPRQITMYLMREELDASYPTIGQELGGRDHTTAMHAYSKIKRDFDSDERVRQDIGSIRQRLYNG